jgi:hypothetical protein
MTMAKAAFNKKNLFTSKQDLNLRNKLVNCYIWSIALCGADVVYGYILAFLLLSFLLYPGWAQCGERIMDIVQHCAES